MITTCKKIFEEKLKKVFDVYEIFKNFFGEDKVDLQGYPDIEDIRGYWHLDSVNTEFEYDENKQSILDNYFNRCPSPFILVYWPNVTVTNEYDKSIDITDLYAKVILDYEGKIPAEEHGFLLNRASYNAEQFLSGYLHSHISRIPKWNFAEFQIPCLGTGPINNTIMSLKTDADEVTWMLFCQELALYVTVESIRGVPYNRLESVGASRTMEEFNHYKLREDVYAINRYTRKITKPLKEFIQYYLEHGHLSLNYRNGKYVPAMSCYDFLIDISNSFIDYFNAELASSIRKEELYPSEIIKAVLAGNGKFYDITSDRSGSSISGSYIGQHVCFFKGRDITLSIGINEEQEKVATTLLYPDIAMHILNNILRTINYRYVNEHKRQGREGNTESSPAYQRVIYI